VNFEWAMTGYWIWLQFGDSVLSGDSVRVSLSLCLSHAIALSGASTHAHTFPLSLPSSRLLFLALSSLPLCPSLFQAKATKRSSLQVPFLCFANILSQVIPLRGCKRFSESSTTLASASLMLLSCRRRWKPVASCTSYRRSRT